MSTSLGNGNITFGDGTVMSSFASGSIPWAKLSSIPNIVYSNEKTNNNRFNPTGSGSNINCNCNCASGFTGHLPTGGWDGWRQVPSPVRGADAGHGNINCGHGDFPNCNCNYYNCSAQYLNMDTGSSWDMYYYYYRCNCRCQCNCNCDCNC